MRRSPVTEQIRPRTPEELGEAVGRKIEELFGTAFQEEGQASAQQPSPVAQAGSMASGPEPEHSRPQEESEPPQEALKPEKTLPSPQTPPETSQGQDGSVPQSSTPTAELERPATSFQELIEQIEALVLNLEWEVSQKSASDLQHKLGEVEKFIPESGMLKNFLTMHRRILARFDDPEVAPHPALVRLLIGSVAALKFLHTSGGKEPLPESLSATLSEGYRTILAVPSSEPSTPPAADRQAEREPKYDLPGLINDLGRKTRALEEVGQRLARIVGVLRKGGDMSGEEITRRLGTLEHLLSEGVGRLLSSYEALAVAAVAHEKEPDAAPRSDDKEGPTGILLVLWEGLPVAIPAAAVVTATPLTRAQAEQFKDKTTITLGSRSLPRLPLKRPEAADKKQPGLPAWFIHLAWGGRNFFILADKSLGYRQIRAGIDLESQGRIRIGATFYTVLRLTRFR